MATETGVTPNGVASTTLDPRDDDAVDGIVDDLVDSIVACDEIEMVEVRGPDKPPDSDTVSVSPLAEPEIDDPLSMDSKFSGTGEISSKSSAPPVKMVDVLGIHKRMEEGRETLSSGDGPHFSRWHYNWFTKSVETDEFYAQRARKVLSERSTALNTKEDRKTLVSKNLVPSKLPRASDREESNHHAPGAMARVLIQAVHTNAARQLNRCGKATKRGEASGYPDLSVSIFKAGYQELLGKIKGSVGDDAILRSLRRFLVPSCNEKGEWSISPTRAWAELIHLGGVELDGKLTACVEKGVQGMYIVPPILYDPSIAREYDSKTSTTVDAIVMVDGVEKEVPIRVSLICGKRQALVSRDMGIGGFGPCRNDPLPPTGAVPIVLMDQYDHMSAVDLDVYAGNVIIFQTIRPEGIAISTPHGSKCVEYSDEGDVLVERIAGVVGTTAGRDQGETFRQPVQKALDGFWLRSLEFGGSVVEYENSGFRVSDIDSITGILAENYGPTGPSAVGWLWIYVALPVVITLAPATLERPPRPFGSPNRFKMNVSAWIEKKVRRMKYPIFGYEELYALAYPGRVCARPRRREAVLQFTSRRDAAEGAGDEICTFQVVKYDRRSDTSVDRWIAARTMDGGDASFAGQDLQNIVEMPYVVFCHLKFVASRSQNQQVSAFSVESCMTANSEYAVPKLLFPMLRSLVAIVIGADFRDVDHIAVAPRREKSNIDCAESSVPITGLYTGWVPANFVAVDNPAHIKQELVNKSKKQSKIYEAIEHTVEYECAFDPDAWLKRNRFPPDCTPADHERLVSWLNTGPKQAPSERIIAQHPILEWMYSYVTAVIVLTVGAEKMDVEAVAERRKKPNQRAQLRKLVDQGLTTHSAQEVIDVLTDGRIDQQSVKMMQKVDSTPKLKARFVYILDFLKALKAGQHSLPHSDAMKEIPSYAPGMNYWQVANAVRELTDVSGPQCARDLSGADDHFNQRMRTKSNRIVLGVCYRRTPETRDAIVDLARLLAEDGNIVIAKKLAGGWGDLVDVMPDEVRKWFVTTWGVLVSGTSWTTAHHTTNGVLNGGVAKMLRTLMPLLRADGTWDMARLAPLVTSGTLRTSVFNFKDTGLVMGDDITVPRSLARFNAAVLCYSGAMFTQGDGESCVVDFLNARYTGMSSDVDGGGAGTLEVVPDYMRTLGGLRVLLTSQHSLWARLEGIETRWPNDPLLSVAVKVYRRAYPGGQKAWAKLVKSEQDTVHVANRERMLDAGAQPSHVNCVYVEGGPPSKASTKIRNEALGRVFDEMASQHQCSVSHMKEFIKKLNSIAALGEGPECLDAFKALCESGQFPLVMEANEALQQSSENYETVDATRKACLEAADAKPRTRAEKATAATSAAAAGAAKLVEKVMNAGASTLKKGNSRAPKSKEVKWADGTATVPKAKTKIGNKKKGGSAAATSKPGDASGSERPPRTKQSGKTASAKGKKSR